MPALTPRLRIVPADPQGEDALALLREAAIEARALYPELHAGDAPWPTNPPTPPGGITLVAYDDGRACGCGALRPIDGQAVELRRMFVRRDQRRTGVARAILQALEVEARRLGYAVMRLETGVRQHAAVALYDAFGFARIPPFGEHVGDPLAVCFEKAVATSGCRLGTGT